MFDSYAAELLANLPLLNDEEKLEAQRALAAGYFLTITRRLRGAELPANENQAKEVCSTLRRTANSLSYVALSDDSAPEDSGTHGAAFAAAEALSILSELTYRNHLPDGAWCDEATGAALEAGLLYMIAGYDVDARATYRPHESRARLHLGGVWSSLLRELDSLCKGIPTTRRYKEIDPTRFARPDLVTYVRQWAAARVAIAVREYRCWLCGAAELPLDEIESQLASIRASLAKAVVREDELLPWASVGTLQFADLNYLCTLLLRAIKATSGRAAIAKFPAPSDASPEFVAEFNTYLTSRSMGHGGNHPRPFLWPSAVRYLDGVRAGSKSAVVSTPTGSGKSHLAEIAVVNALASGWVLYLAPTNALVAQIRRDLQRGLRSFSTVEVSAFLGGMEYTIGEEPILGAVTQVRVMTPEKASLFIRLYPEAFETCSLCVLDECHVIGEASRGAVADALMAHLSGLAPNAGFLLMSAMISNADHLAGWLSSLRPDDPPTVPIDSAWRPCRTMRGLIALDAKSLRAQKLRAADFFKTAPASRVNYSAPLGLTAVVGLSGPWTADDSRDYLGARLPIAFDGKLRRDGSVNDAGWKNDAGRSVSAMLAASGLPTINFILANKHHAFSSAESVSVTFANGRRRIGLSDDVSAMMDLAEAELGTRSRLRDLLVSGVAVHTAALLPMERQASEKLFGDGSVSLMFATATLAMGLNLPAMAVVISGTSIGDPTEDISVETLTARTDATILNSFGRAGRPGVSNRGIALLVTDHPYRADLTPDMNPVTATEKYPVLSKRDASVEIHSPIERLIDSVVEGGELLLGEDADRDQFLVLLSAPETHSRATLSRTFGAYHRRDLLSDEILTSLDDAVSAAWTAQLADLSAPDWIVDVAIRSGLTVERAALIWQSYQGIVSKYDLSVSYSTTVWTNLFFRILAGMPVAKMGAYLPQRSTTAKSFRIRMFDAAADIELGKPGSNFAWLRSWMQAKSILLQFMGGADYATIAKQYLGLPLDEQCDEGRGSGKPLPKTIELLSSFTYQLSLDAGCFVAIHERALTQADAGPVPETLSVLPQALRYGCDCPITLAWFTTSLQNRVVAHHLARRFSLPSEKDVAGARHGWMHDRLKSWVSSQEVELDPVLSAAKTLLRGTV